MNQKTCKDCIRYEVCKYKDEKVSLGTKTCELVADDFKCFKDKSRIVELPCKVGDTVWIVERDGYGDACDVSGFLFMGICNNAVIVTVARYNHNNGIDHILQKHIEETAEDYGTYLSVFPIDDMYLTCEEAKKALERMKEDEKDNIR